MSLNRRQIHEKEDDDDILDSFTLIWLDKTCKEDSFDSLRTRTLLKQNNENNCLFYDQIHLFLNDIEEKKLFQIKCILITSGYFAEIIFKQSIAEKFRWIIIFCNDLNKYEKYSTISNGIDICIDHDSLATSIKRHIPLLRTALFDSYHLNTTRSIKTNSYNSRNDFFSYLFFVEILKQVPESEQAKEFMLKKAKIYYYNNSAQMKDIQTFRDSYQPSDAIKWYTEDSFVYRLLNKAFRTDDTSMWYIFRYFIRDLCEQMEEVH